MHYALTHPDSGNLIWTVENIKISWNKEKAIIRNVRTDKVCTLELSEEEDSERNWRASLYNRTIDGYVNLDDLLDAEPCGVGSFDDLEQATMSCKKFLETY